MVSANDQCTKAEAREVHVATSGKHHGIALWPPPSTDPNDPLRWPRWVKVAAIIVTGLINFSSNFAGAGISVATPVLEMQYRKSASQVNALLTYNFLMLGIGNMFWVPLASKFGKRASLLVSTLLQFLVMIWLAEAKSFPSLLGARILQGFAAGAGESIVPGIVSDIFFLHERASMMSLYVIFTTAGSAVGPLISGFVVAYTHDTWRNVGWMCAGLLGFNFVMLYFLYPESNFHRPETYEIATAEEVAGEKQAASAHMEGDIAIVNEGVQHVNHVDISWIKVWTSAVQFDRNISFVQAFARPFAFLLYPDVLWAVLVYGTTLGAQIILIFGFPALLLAPPYLWPAPYIGLIQIAALIGFTTACFIGGWLADIITTRLILRAKGAFVPEQRLVALAPACWVGPAGCIVIAFCCDQKLSWIGIAFGFGMVSFGTVFAPNIAITYVVESHPEFSSDCLVFINVFKNLVAFVLAFVAVDWVHAKGWIEVYMILFMLATLSMALAVPLYFYGKTMRRWSARVCAPKAWQARG